VVRRRGQLAPASLTSLVDVLFILVFAALVQRAGAAAIEPIEPARPAFSASTAERRSPWMPPPQVEQLRRAAIARITEQLQDQPAIIARVSARGVLTSIEMASAGLAQTGAGATAEPSGEGALVDRRRESVAMELPLIERVDDPDVAIAYVGDRDARQRLCAVVAGRMGSLANALVVIAVDAPLTELMISLVSGLRRDVEDCLTAHRAAAVLLDSSSWSAMPPASSATLPNPSEGNL
jgi:hypothetical protein